MIGYCESVSCIPVIGPLRPQSVKYFRHPELLQYGPDVALCHVCEWEWRDSGRISVRRVLV